MISLDMISSFSVGVVQSAAACVLLEKKESLKFHLAWAGVSLRIAAAGEQCKVTGEYFERAKPFPRKELQNEPGNSAF